MSDMSRAAFGGMMTGIGAGNEIAGPLGALIGGGIGLAAGRAKGRAQQGLNKAYERAESAVQPVDPDQVAFLNRLRQQERFYRSGMDAASGFARQDQMNALAQTQANIARMGGGINQLLQAQHAANMGQAAIGAQASRMADPMLTAQGNLTDLIAQRKYDYYQRQRDVAMARMEQGRQDINNMFSGALGTMPNLMARITRQNEQKQLARALTGGAGGAAMGMMPGGAASRAAMGLPGVMKSGYAQPQPVMQQYQSPQNYGFSYQQPQPNYGFNYQPPRPNYGFAY